MKYLFTKDYGEHKAGTMIEIADSDEAQRLYLATGGYLVAMPDVQVTDKPNDVRMEDAPPADRMQRRRKAR